MDEAHQRKEVKMKSVFTFIRLSKGQIFEGKTGKLKLDEIVNLYVEVEELRGSQRLVYAQGKVIEVEDDDTVHIEVQ